MCTQDLTWVLIKTDEEFLLAVSPVLVGHADGEGWALDEAADLSASLGSEDGLCAELVAGAARIVGAAADLGADASELVLGVSLAALAHRAVVDDSALLAVGAGHDLARVKAGAVTGNAHLLAK